MNIDLFVSRHENMADEMELDVWLGDWGLPSIDSECLAVMAYCKFAGVPVEIHKKTHGWGSPSGELPVLRQNGEAITDVHSIFNHLRKKNWGTDFDVSAKQSADIVAFTAMIEGKLIPALNHVWWVDSKNYTELTRPWYGNTMPVPLNHIKTYLKQKRLANHILALHVDNLTDIDQEAKMYKDAKECLNNLSAKLGDNQYFFGNSPTSLDALVFGHLAPLVKATFPNPSLQNHLKGCSNLWNFCMRILDKFFPLSPEDIEFERKKREEERQKAAEAGEFPNRRRNMIISSLVAITAMISYAFLSGLIQIQITDFTGGGNNHSHEPKLPDFNEYDNLFEEQERERKKKGNERQ